MMRMTNRNRQCIRRIGTVDLYTRQMEAPHMVNLRLGGMTHADHGFFHRIGRIFPDHQPELRRNQQRDPPRLPQFQRGDRILVDEGIFHRRRLRGVLLHHKGQLNMET